MTTELIHFRLLVTPCCTTLLCWVNPRLPTYCPECGSHLYPEVKSHIYMEDRKAVIKYSEESLAAYHRSRPTQDTARSAEKE
jgi:hypothetical protein